MFFGLVNTYINYQKYISKIVAKNFEVFYIIYFNNILLFIKNSS